MTTQTTAPLTDITLADLRQSEVNLKASWVAVGRGSGLSDEAIESHWKRVQYASDMFVLGCLFGNLDPAQDIHLADL